MQKRRVFTGGLEIGHIHYAAHQARGLITGGRAGHFHKPCSFTVFADKTVLKRFAAYASVFFQLFLAYGRSVIRMYVVQQVRTDKFRGGIAGHLFIQRAYRSELARFQDVKTGSYRVNHILKRRAGFFLYCPGCFFGWFFGGNARGDLPGSLFACRPGG